MHASNHKLSLCSLLCCTALTLSSAIYGQMSGVEQARSNYNEHCATCHGDSFEGTAIGVPLLGDLRHGDTNSDIISSISNGYSAAGMPAWRDTLDTSAIRNLALLITESRANINYDNFNYSSPLELPEDRLSTELHDFRMETIVSDLDAQPFSIEPLPDGRILLTEKKFGIRIIDTDGTKSDYLEGTPEVFSDTYIATLEQEWGVGWLFDLKLHPNYEDNGWIYLQYGDRCEDCNAISRDAGAPVSMNKLVRGKIVDGAWVEQETIWEADIEHYGLMTDVAAGGRITFDNAGHVFVSVGMKGISNFQGIQDLSTPWGKVHRLNVDGTIPEDNPFADRDDVYRSIYTWGHRSPQGLEFDFNSGELWGTEHGPRGGDEVNLLLPGENYGWPLYSQGMNYNGTPVDYGKDLGIAFELSDIQQPVVDLTPSPAVSSFIISSSNQFPEWEGDFLVGSLKARSLYRFDIENNRLAGRETLIEGVARIRDIETAYNGDILLLLEHNSGSRIVRLAPE